MGEMAQEAEDWALEEECRQSVLRGEPDQPTTPAPDRTAPSDPQAAAPESEWDLTEAIATSPIWKLAAAMAGPVRYSQHSWNLTVRSYACDLDRSLRRTGLVITAPDAPADGMVGRDVIEQAVKDGFDTARIRWNEKLREYNGELDALDAYAVEVTAITNTVMTALEAAAEGGPGERGEGE